MNAAAFLRCVTVRRPRVEQCLLLFLHQAEHTLSLGHGCRLYPPTPQPGTRLLSRMKTPQSGHYPTVYIHRVTRYPIHLLAGVRILSITNRNIRSSNATQKEVPAAGKAAE